ncbi:MULTISPECIES: GNAT family N-acetyltransferase [unclassified Streptomyces]|uniref:GNAT family N-acetyltransferase n=1 Tax=unclassified Streptomyces TaxID=2593676 RepID=UPI0013680524|nr:MULTISPECIES: GNAT family N-acetyltransferase [unclassified Streptomyces]NEA04281.1 GNAT family N-acetyltransferase [Streptomyces sp. SID10116]MYY83340.1 GNAT family N-acetyltransferase [Streptomyces sp. SID335]MYZ13153.1 GNAT family N-acetyltransferase [Streptomyces sp. SID337]NDZ86018.1 GNAT family N-acetyltransferase [Streptomyces sp. SID10115]NEB42985.1 GNAT family N-acetyltransferase [Streptomyces sp. SID339]
MSDVAEAAVVDDVEVRAVADEELPAWLRAVQAGFLNPFAAMSDDAVAHLRSRTAPARTLGAYDRGRCVGTYRSFRQEVTAVGGAPVVANAVSGVTVAPTHRRRGILSRMMAGDLAEARERGDVLATLNSAEYPIYGRYGFGAATWVTEWTVDVPRSGLDPRWSGPEESGARIDLVDGDDVRKHGPELFERFRAARHGVVSRDEEWWLRNTGMQATPEFPWQEPFYALYRDPSGQVEGLVAYRTTNNEWGPSRLPRNAATVLGITAVTPAAERALWHYVCAIDKVVSVRSGWLAPDDLLPHLLPDPRAATVTGHADWLWVRILDVVRALEARTYAGSGTVVLEIGDSAGLAGGRYRLDATPQGASCVPTTATADLVLDVRELGEMWLGDASVARAVALGRVGEERTGAAAVADALFRTSRRPWCPDMF